MDVRPELLAWAVGLGVFVAFAGAAALGPPDPVSQLAYAGALVVFAVPGVYVVLRAQGHGIDQSGGSAPALFAYVVVATVGSVLAAAAAGFVPAVRGNALASRLVPSVAFLAAFLSVSWLAARRARRRREG